MSFNDLNDFIALPRLNSLTAAPDGSALVGAAQTLNSKQTAWTTSLWWLDPAGERPARRLTRGDKGENGAAFTPDGDLLFLAKRPSEDEDEKAPAALWLLPREGGDPRIVATHPGGFEGIAVRGTTLLAFANTLPHSETLEQETERRKERAEKKVSAILHTSYPVRYWDHDLGPGYPRAYVADLAELATADRLTLRDLTPDAGKSLTAAHADLSPDGAFIATSWTVPLARGDFRNALTRIDAATGERRILVDDPAAEFFAPSISPDGTQIAVIVDMLSTPELAPSTHLELIDSETGVRRRLAENWDNWPGHPVWLRDGSALVMAADTDGRAPLYLVPLDGSEPRRLTADGTYSSVEATPEAIYALRTSYEFPNEPVRLPLSALADDVPEAALAVLPSAAARPELPGTLAEVETTAADGARVRGWLALPAGASADSPSPLVLWIHGGPLSSWNAWSWRWCPWLLVAQGYAVLLPDPALSTGYGQEFIQRGWGSWGEAPYTDLMAITDSVEAREDIDATRTAAMGGSFGGYMANWVAGHTDRFDAIVTHASLWALDQFGPTTDASNYWQRELSPEMMIANSPHNSVAEIRTPLLVIHGDNDYRVPIGEGLRLWYELLSASGLAAGDGGQSPHQFLYFPDENHWVLTPQHAKIWYQVVLNFLGEKVLGAAPERIELLG